MGVTPYVVHQTFQYGGVKGKRHRLREAMLWSDPPEYYSEGQYLHAELVVLPAPEDFEQLPDFEMSLFHLKNMELQLLQVHTTPVACHAICPVTRLGRLPQQMQPRGKIFRG
jgi:hypothetical protein